MSRKCRHKACRSELPPVKQCESLFQRKGFCGTGCVADHARAKNEQRRAKEARREKEQRRDRLKTKSDWTKEAQKAFNSYIRERDYGMPCASCGSMPEKKYGGAMDCSHYRSVGAAPHMRFNVFNAAAACVKCNRYLSGNVAELRKGLINRFGREKMLQIESDQSSKRYTIEHLQRIKKIMNKKAALLRRKRL